MPTTVKVSAETRDRIRSLGDGTLEDTILEALDALEATRFWAQADAAAEHERSLDLGERARRAAVDAELDRRFDAIS